MLYARKKAKNLAPQSELSLYVITKYIRAFLERLEKLLAEEWDKPYPTGRGFINDRMSIALVRATNRCMRGSRIPASHMSNRSRREGGAGFGLVNSDN